MQSKAIMALSIPEHKEKLRKALLDAIAFDKKERVGFVENFEYALKLLDSEIEEVNRYLKTRSVPISDYPDLEKRRVLAVAKAAWVFGAMGSWYDVSFSDSTQKEYDKVTKVLYEAVAGALKEIAPWTEHGL